MPIEDSHDGLVSEEPKLNKISSVNSDASQQLDPKKLFDLVSKNYETWSQVINRQFNEEENFSPFPREDENENNKNSQPIFNYSLLEALEKASSEFSDRLSKLEENEILASIPENKPAPVSSTASQSTKKNQDIVNTAESLLKESEINFLRNKISQMITSNDFAVNHNTSYRPPHVKREGFSLYDTQDEEGLHEGNTDQYFDGDDQDDYDLEEVNDGETFSYDCPPSHHIEVELNTAPECEEHGLNGCDCPMFDNEERNIDGRFGENGPSCEFTFEYDHNGKLVPTYSNVEEKLRLMSLQSRISSLNQRVNKLKLPSINELNISGPNLDNEPDKKSKKKNKKKKNRSNSIQHPNMMSKSSCCLFCEYEAIYGCKPRQMIKWYDQRIKKDELRREEIKKKLENAKSKALRKQRELRQKQLQKQKHNNDITIDNPTENETNEISNDNANTNQKSSKDIVTSA